MEDEEDEETNSISGGENLSRHASALAEASFVSHVAININQNSETKFSKNTLKAVQILQNKFEQNFDAISFEKVTAGV